MDFRNTEEINTLSEIMINKENKLIELETDVDTYKYRLKKLANENLNYERILLETLKFEVKNFLEYFNITKSKDKSKLGVFKKQNKVDYVYFTFEFNKNMYTVYIPKEVQEITKENYLDYYKTSLYIEEKPYCWSLIQQFDTPEKVRDYLRKIKGGEV